MPAPTYLVLDRASALLALEGLSSSRHSRAVPTYTDILVALSTSPNGGRSIRLPITDGLGDVLRSVHVRPGLVSSVRHCRYVATYRHPEDPTVPDVTVRSYDRPRMRRTLNGPGGRRRYIRVSITKEEHPMAARTTRTRAKSRTKAKPAEELDDLEALEELEDLEDIEDDEPAPAKRGRSRAKAKAKPEPEPEDDDEDEDDEDLEDEDDDDEEEDEEPAPRKRRASRTAKPAARSTSKRSATSAAKAKAKPAAKKSAVGASGPRPVPGGKLSVTDVADMAGTNGAAVRQWLRRNDWPKDEELGRYTFTKKEAASIVKKLNA